MLQNFRVCHDVMLSQADVLGAAKLTQQENIPGRSSHAGLCTNATTCRSACFCGIVFLLTVFDDFHAYMTFTRLPNHTNVVFTDYVFPKMNSNS